MAVLDFANAFLSFPPEKIYFPRAELVPSQGAPRRWLGG
jgi:hypothetical protein